MIQMVRAGKDWSSLMLLSLECRQNSVLRPAGLVLTLDQGDSKLVAKLIDGFQEGRVKSSKLTSESAPFSFRINSSRRYCKHERLACHFAVALLVQASPLASRMRPVVVLSANHAPGFHVSY
jgi:hypothetical protein